MPLFRCQKCNCVDNTACGGTYWSKDMDIWPDEVRGQALCAECSPTHYSGGKPKPNGGKWHGRFKKVDADEAGYIDCEDGFLYKPEEVAPGGYFHHLTRPLEQGEK